MKILKFNLIFAFFVLFFLSFSIDVNAQSCGGGFICGTTIVEVCTDIYGNTCRDETIPGCTCNYECQGLSVSGECRSFYPVSPCDARGICETRLGVCIKSGSCSLSFSSTPTPPPGGGGGGGGGTWGACGSCSTCGYDSRQCRLDPNGVCVWDPSGCPIGGGATCPWTDNRPFCVGEGESASFCRSQPGANPNHCQCCSGLVENRSGICVCSPSCTISVGVESTNIAVGGTTKATAYLTIQKGTLQSPGVTFTQRDPNPLQTQILTFASYPNPTPFAFSDSYSDNSSPYQSTVRGEASGSAFVRVSASVTSDGISYTCRADTSSRVNVTAADCSCSPNFSTSLVSGETRTGVNIATLSNYSDPVTVSTSDNTKLVLLNNSQEVDSVQTTGPNVTVDMKAKDTEERSIVFLNIQSPSSGGGASCNCNYSVIINPNNYFQAINADVVARGNIISFLPENEYLLLKKGNTSNDTPGIVFYGNRLRLGSGTVSSTNWQANTDVSLNYSNYRYSYFSSKVPSEVRTRWEEERKVLNGTLIPITRSLSDLISQDEYILKSNYYWTKVVGNLEINESLNFSSKMVILVDGNVTIKGNITLTNSGFLMIIASGNVSIDPEVREVSGIILADNTFYSGTKGTRQDSQLLFKGTVFANKISLQRSLPTTNPPQPAELFEYNPSYVLDTPYYFWVRKKKWREVNP